MAPSQAVTSLLLARDTLSPLHRGCVSIFLTGQLASPRESDQEITAEMAMSFIALASEVTHHHFGHNLLATQTDLDTMMAGAAQGCDPRLQGPLEPTLDLTAAVGDAELKSLAFR